LSLHRRIGLSCRFVIEDAKSNLMYSWDRRSQVHYTFAAMSLSYLVFGVFPVVEWLSLGRWQRFVSGIFLVVEWLSLGR